jgi:hypothetical protein
MDGQKFAGELRPAMGVCSACGSMTLGVYDVTSDSFVPRFKLKHLNDCADVTAPIVKTVEVVGLVHFQPSGAVK